MNSPHPTTPRGTDFSFIRMLISYGESYQPRIGDAVDIVSADLRE